MISSFLNVPHGGNLNLNYCFLVFIFNCSFGCIKICLLQVETIFVANCCMSSENLHLKTKILLGILTSEIICFSAPVASNLKE